MSAVTKIGLVDFPPLSFAFLRFLIASFCVLPFMIGSTKSFISSLKDLGLVSILASFNNALFVVGLQMTTATISQLIYALVPLFVFGILSIFLSHKHSVQKVLGTGVGFIGITIVILLPILESGKAFTGDLGGNILITIGAICWSIYMVRSKEFLKRYSPFVITSMFIFVTTIFLFPFFIYELWTNSLWWKTVEHSAIHALVYVIFIGTILTYTLNQYAIKHGGSLLASMSFYLSPILGFIAAFFLLGEQLTLGIIIGGALALLGVFLVGT